MAPARRPPALRGEVPKEFHLRRDLPLGRHPILSAFPGLNRISTARRHEPDAKKREALYRETHVELVDEDLWMYIAPWEVPPFARRRGWKPVVAPQVDCVVIGEKHLRESPELILFLDIFHELRHILQRHAGAELFDGSTSYVRRPTEIDAYRFVVEEARRLGVANAEIREYLKVEWVSEDEFHELLETLGVPRT